MTETHFKRDLFQGHAQTTNKVVNASEVILHADIGNGVLALWEEYDLGIDTSVFRSLIFPLD